MSARAAARRTRTLAGALALAAAAGGCTSSPKRARSAEDPNDYTKAFAELDKNDREDPNDKPPAPSTADGPEKPKGPVYPAPFTAEQIRAATRNGRTYRYKVEIPNEPTREHVITFRNVDEGGAEVHQGSDHARRMSWTTLQRHAEFPRDKVSTHPEKLKTPAGKFECVVYEVTGEDGEVWTYYFAKKLPGAPVYFYVERNGKRLKTTTLVEHVPGK
jgi:hypothetical protein